MTIGNPKFDGDSHESSAHWFGMTVLFGACITLIINCQFFFSAFVPNTENKLKNPVKSPWFFDKYYSLQQVPPIV